MIKYIATLSLVLSFSFGYSQKNIKHIVQSNDNFFEIQKEVNEYFDDKYCEEPECVGDDSEYHKYKRWEWYWENRVNEDGSMPNLIEVAKSVDQFKQKLSQKSGTYDIEKYDWTNITQTKSLSGYNGMGRVTSMGFDPIDPSTFYIGAPQGGIWKTTDNGSSYTNIGEDLPYVSVGNILVDYEDPNTIYISVGDHSGWWSYGLGVYKSTDGGSSWQPTQFAHELHREIAIMDMAMSPTNPKLMLAATNDGLYRTSDGWLTSTRIRQGEYNSVKFNPADELQVIAGHRLYENSVVIKSNDAGMTWKTAEGIIGMNNWTQFKMNVSPSHPNIMYVMGSDKNFYRSEDSGETFEWVSTMDNFGPVVVSGLNPDIVYAGTLNVYESLDGGQTWSQKTNWYENGEIPTVHADQRNAYNNPHDLGQIYFCNDGGVYFYREPIDFWYDISDGLIIMQFYKMATAQTDENIIIGGTQDNGGRMRTANGFWRATNGGDAMEVAIDPTDHNTIYTTYINGLLYRSRDGWNNDVYHCISCNIPGKADEAGGRWVTPYLLDPNDPETIIAGYERVWKSTDQGDNWEAVSDELLGGDDIQALAVAPSNSDYMYASINNRLWGTKDGGENWESIYKPSGATTTSIHVDENDENKIYLSQGGYNPFYKVIVSDDWENWENLSHDLPNAPINTVSHRYTKDGEIIFAGTDVGLFVLAPDSDTWERYGTNLPFTVVTDVEYQNSSNKIRISTYGRGIFEADLPSDLSAVADQSTKLDIDLYPNPTEDILNIETEHGFDRYEIIDRKGVSMLKGALNKSVDVQQLNSGVYFIQLKSSDTGISQLLRFFKK